MSKVPAPRSRSEGWETLKSLRSYGARLLNQPKHRPLDVSKIGPDPAENALNNCLEFIDGSARHMLRRNDLDILPNGGLDADVDSNAHALLKSLCVALEQTVNMDLFSASENRASQTTIPIGYPKVYDLLGVLAETQWQFEVVTGASHRILHIPSLGVAQQIKSTLDEFNDFFSKIRRPSLKDSRLPETTRPTKNVAVDPQNATGIGTLASLSKRLSKLNVLPSCHHQVWLQLLRQDPHDPNRSLQESDLYITHLPLAQ